LGVNWNSSLRQIARRFIADRRGSNGAVALQAPELERLLGDVVAARHKWTPVELERPKEGRRVLFYSTATGEIHVGSRWGTQWYDDQEFVQYGERAAVESVTHWMRFPRRPPFDG
jgi:hypothetical protein